MRLVCPNCDAEYEVDASAIPDSGRDVQCSNCGHAWFQLPPSLEEELAAEEALFNPPPELKPVPEGPEDADAEEEPADLPASPPPRALDESVLAVLREEAEREAAARRTETPPPIETQEELGLTAPPAPPAPPEPEEADPVAERLARLKGAPPAAAKPQSRREMLPEIDEINTTLRATSERREGEAAAVADSLPAARNASAFRTGFVLMLLLGLAVAFLYVMAPKLSEQIPAAKGALDHYVALIDGLRIWLNGAVRGGGP